MLYTENTISCTIGGFSPTPSFKQTLVQNSHAAQVKIFLPNKQKTQVKISINFHKLEQILLAKPWEQRKAF